MDAPSIDLALRHALGSGDTKLAARLLVEHYADDVYATCRAMLRDRTLAEDLAQETFGRAIVALATFRGESSPRTWLLSIARNGCLDVLRRRNASPIDDTSEAEPDAHAASVPLALDTMMSREDLERALAPLGETERAIVVLHFGHGVGYPELAQAFSLKEGAVRMRMSRAVEKMRAALAAPEVAHEVSFAAPRRAVPQAPAAAPAPYVPPPSGAAPPAPASAGAPPAQDAPPKRGWWPFGRERVPSGGPPSVPQAPAARARASAAPSIVTRPASPLRDSAPDTLRARLLALVASA
ncbi:MAG: sigma-70 family RNA polymerase sigma factor [Sandaracinus sp.]